MAHQVVLLPRKARVFFGRHPWVLDSAIDRVAAGPVALDLGAVGSGEGNPADGDEVDLVSDRGQWIARGVWNSRSRIRVRLYTWQHGEELDDAFWRRRLVSAVELRRRLRPHDPDGAERLVFSEGDGLGGLVVDRYAGHLVVQVTALAIAVRLERILPTLIELIAPVGVLVRADKNMSRLEGLDLPEGPCFGTPPDGPVFISEHGLRYGIDIAAGQKTGFFLDQRENRRAAAGYFAGLRVLDMFCYSGGFAIAALGLGQATEVLAIDSSARAIALAKSNAQLNNLAHARFEIADGFHALQTLRAEGARFGAVVLDPPRFARNRQTVNDALRAYLRLNRLAVEVLSPGGILVTCSCTGHVHREHLLDTLAEVSRQTGRDIQVLEQRGAAPDHPTSASCLETEYLKCFICRVV